MTSPISLKLTGSAFINDFKPAKNARETRILNRRLREKKINKNTEPDTLVIM